MIPRLKIMQLETNLIILELTIDSQSFLFIYWQDMRMNQNSGPIIY